MVVDNMSVPREKSHKLLRGMHWPYRGGIVALPLVSVIQAKLYGT